MIPSANSSDTARAAPRFVPVHGRALEKYEEVSAPWKPRRARAERTSGRAATRRSHRVWVRPGTCDVIAFDDIWNR